MRLTRRDAAKLGLGLAALRFGCAPAHAQASGAVVGAGIRAHGHSLVGSLRYGPDYPHFDYVNPQAPKGGAASYFAGFRYDSFNPYIVGGTPSAAAGFVIESLMETPADAGSTHYGLLAEWMESGPEESWAAFRLRDGARWHDGRPVTVEDAIFSFDVLTGQGLPFWRAYYAHVVSARDAGDRTVLFEFDQKDNRELPHIIGQLPILPAHWWADRQFAETSLEPPLGSGPYRIGGFEAGRYVDLERVPDYWGADLPVNIGRHNFDSVRLEYFGDMIAAFEAFKGGDLDFNEEFVARRWALQYDFPAITSGAVVKKEALIEGPKSVAGFFYNLRRPKFTDRRTREAFNLLLDFENMNKTIYYNQYARPSSYFQGAPDLMATGLPDPAELALLEPHRAALPSALFETPFEQPATDGSGRLPRSMLRRASALLDAAGWRVVEGKRVDVEGAPLSIEFLYASKTLEPTIRPFVANLERVGIVATLRSVDPAQYEARRRVYDFDCIAFGVANTESPGNEQRDFWGSAAVDVEGGQNYCGVANPIVDALIERIVFAEDRDGLAAACRALDRVLLFEHYVTLRAYAPFDRIAYWRDRVAGPDPLPSRSVDFPTAWWSVAGGSEG